MLDTNPLSVLFVASEVEGLIKSGGLADVARALPEALQHMQHDVRICMPAYTGISNLSEAEIKRLDEIGFEWESRSRNSQIFENHCNRAPRPVISCYVIPMKETKLINKFRVFL